MDNNEEKINYRNIELEMRKYSNAIPAIVGKMVGDVAFEPLLMFGVYTWHLFNAQASKDWPGTGDKYRKYWEDLNLAASNLTVEGLETIFEVMNDPEKSKLRLDGEPSFIPPKLILMAPSTDIVQ